MSIYGNNCLITSILLPCPYRTEDDPLQRTHEEVTAPGKARPAGFGSTQVARRACLALAAGATGRRALA